MDNKPEKLILDYSEWRGLALKNAHTIPATDSDINKIFDNLALRDNGCIEWTKGKNADGYGYVFINPQRFRVHRLVYLLIIGEIPSGSVVCHKCDNRLCANVNHLFIGTKAKNNADRKNKGRNRDQSGEKNNQSKLSKDQVLYILASGERNKFLSSRFGISVSNVEGIKGRYTWTHISDIEIEQYRREVINKPLTS